MKKKKNNDRLISAICFLSAVVILFVTGRVLATPNSSGILLGMSMPKLYETSERLTQKLALLLTMPSISFDGSGGRLYTSDIWEFFYAQQESTPSQESEPEQQEEVPVELSDILESLEADEVFAPYTGDMAETGVEVLALNMHPSDAANYITWSLSYIKNKSIQTFDTDSLMRGKLDIGQKAADGAPEVLIYHSHTTEAYNTSGDIWYADTPTHSIDAENNVVAVGEVFAQTLTSMGIETIHCTDRQDTTYTESYKMSYQTVEEYLEQYPSIRVVIDLHRDAVSGSNGAQYRPVVQVDGLQTAQVMVVVGVGDNEAAANEHWQDNLRFGITLNDTLEQLYPGITRALAVRTSHFNQQLSKGALLIEVGMVGNTLTEAKRAAYFTALALSEVMEENG